MQPGRGVTALAVLLASGTVLAACASLEVVLRSNDWVGPAVLATAVVTAVSLFGVAGRWSWFGSLLAQLLALALLVWIRFPAEAYGGYGRLIETIQRHIERSVPPAPWVPELAVVIVAVVGLLVIAGNVLATRLPALVALPALTGFAIGSTFAIEPLPWYLFVAPAAGYILLLAVSARARSAGQRGHLEPEGSSPLRRGGVLALVASLALGAAVIAAAYGASSRVTAVDADGLLPRAGYEGPALITSLTGDLLRGQDTPLLRVSGPIEVGNLRTTALEVWTNGDGWTSGPIEPLPAPESSERSYFTITVDSLGYRGDFLPVPYGAASITSSLEWQYVPQTSSWYHAGAGDVGTYTVGIYNSFGLDPITSQEEIARLTDVGDLDPQVRAMAESLTSGIADNFSKVQRLRDWFLEPSHGFTYSLYLPEGTTGDPLLDFLEHRTGYCQQYASALAVMTRSLGIPARVVVGFGPGERQEDGSFLITAHDAHSWVEAYLPASGWYGFDATPPRSRIPTPTASASATMEATPSAQAEVDDALVPSAPAVNPSAGADLPVAGTGDAPAEADGTNEAHGFTDWPVLLAALGALGVGIGPSLVRQARRGARQRRARARGLGASAEVWAELTDLARDYRVPLAPGASLRRDAEEIADAARLDVATRAPIAGVVTALEREWYGRGGADRQPTGRADDGEALVALIRDVQLGLARHRFISRADRWFPRSLRPRLRGGSDNRDDDGGRGASREAPPAAGAGKPERATAARR